MHSLKRVCRAQLWPEGLSVPAFHDWSFERGDLFRGVIADVKSLPRLYFFRIPYGSSSKQSGRAIDVGRVWNASYATDLHRLALLRARFERCLANDSDLMEPAGMLHRLISISSLLFMSVEGR